MQECCVYIILEHYTQIVVFIVTASINTWLLANSGTLSVTSQQTSFDMVLFRQIIQIRTYDVDTFLDNVMFRTMATVCKSCQRERQQLGDAYLSFV